jgi:biopolymer transport protein ExbD
MKKHIITALSCLALVLAMTGCTHTKPVVISIAPSGAMEVAGRPCPPDQLATRLAEIADREVVVRADQSAPFMQVAEVMDACKAAGIHQVSIASAK